MSDPHPLMALLLSGTSFVGEGIDVEAEIQPLPEQLAFGPGDVAVLATAQTQLEKDFAILKGLDPKGHAETFPDWEERMLGVNNVGQGSFVLCEHFSAEDPEKTIGWFSRVKLMPISMDRYEETLKWIDDGFPSEIPDWVRQYYVRYTDALSKNAPARVPQTVVCPECGEREVELVVSRRILYSGHAGMLTKDGKERFITIAEPVVKDTHTAQLRCTGCHTVAELEDEEWELPGISS